MAELKVEPKRGMGWIWVVIVLVVLAIVAWLLFARGDMGTTSPDTVNPDTTVGFHAPVVAPALI
jgi:hypothetical protein